jgi:hypothetical protein
MMNVRLLRKIAKVIQEKPRQFDMRWLHMKANKPTLMKCGTAHCILGWASVMLKKDIGNGGSGCDALGVDMESLNRLIFVGGWPIQFSKPHETRKTNHAKAKIAAARIEHFIKTKGAE